MYDVALDEPEPDDNGEELAYFWPPTAADVDDYLAQLVERRPALKLLLAELKAAGCAGRAPRADLLARIERAVGPVCGRPACPVRILASYLCLLFFGLGLHRGAKARRSGRGPRPRRHGR